MAPGSDETELRQLSLFDIPAVATEQAAPVARVMAGVNAGVKTRYLRQAGKLLLRTLNER